MGLRVHRGGETCDHLGMELTGITTDVPVADLTAARSFYETLFGRAADVLAGVDTMEWILRRDPEVALRLVVSREVSAVRVGLGVADVEAERSRLLLTWPGLPAVQARRGVIATLDLEDLDGNRVVVWQDLLPR